MIESAEQFVALRTSDKPEEYRRAAHDEATEEVWLDVIRRFPDMKKWVAHNKTVPLSILDLLSRDPNSDVRWWVAEKRKAGADILGRLADDPDEGVRHRVACNAKAPRDVLECLVRDPSPLVATAARERLQVRFDVVVPDQSSTGR
jgi:hypothetical protein